VIRRFSTKIFITLFLSIVGIGQPILAKEPLPIIDWELAKNKGGIKIYTRSTENSNLLSYKAEAEVSAELSELFDFFQDTTVTTQWVYNLKSIDVINQQENFDAQYYVIYSTPWPVSDVSAVLDATWKYDHAKGLLKNSTISIAPGKYADDDFIHVPLISTENHFQKLEDGKIKMTIEVAIDHGYLLPDLVVDTISVETFYLTLESLKKVDYKKYGVNVDLSAIDFAAIE
jgi:hypothetical protein